MKLRRSILLYLFLATFLGGLYVQLSSSHYRWLSALDRKLSPLQHEKFMVGAKVADPFHEDERAITVRRVLGPTDPKLDVLVCAIDDDPEEINAFGLYHPADIAITCLNLQELGIKRAYLSTHLHWPNLDEASNGTLASAIAKFDSAVVATPLRRRFEASPISPAFYRSSIPLDRIDGDYSLFPVVNHQNHPPTLELPNNTLIGFSVIESEQSQGSEPMLARWDDRIVFSAPLLHLLHESNASLDEVQIIPGEYIRLGAQGRFIPIDEFGRFHYQDGLTIPNPARSITSAQSANTSIIGAQQSSAILIANGSQTQKFAAIPSPLAQLTQLLNTPRAGAAEPIQRFPIWAEVSLLLIISLFAIRVAGYRPARLLLSYLTILLILWLLLLGLYHGIHYWSPISSYLSALLICWTLSAILAKPLARH